jgi:hypothetical protein
MLIEFSILTHLVFRSIGHPFETMFEVPMVNGHTGRPMLSFLLHIWHWLAAKRLADDSH